MTKSVTWAVFIHGNPVPANCEHLTSIPANIDSYHLLEILEKAPICIGNSDHQFVEMAMERKGQFNSKDGKERVAYLDAAVLVLALQILPCIEWHSFLGESG